MRIELVEMSVCTPPADEISHNNIIQNAGLPDSMYCSLRGHDVNDRSLHTANVNPVGYKTNAEPDWLHAGPGRELMMDGCTGSCRAAPDMSTLMGLGASASLG